MPSTKLVKISVTSTIIKVNTKTTKKGKINFTNLGNKIFT